MNSRAQETQGEVQDPSVSSTVRILHQTITRPRIRNIRPDSIGLYYPILSTYHLFPDPYEFAAGVLDIILPYSFLLFLFQILLQW